MAEGAPLLREYGVKIPSRVRIPPSPSVKSYLESNDSRVDRSILNLNNLHQENFHLLTLPNKLKSVVWNGSIACYHKIRRKNNSSSGRYCKLREKHAERRR